MYLVRDQIQPDAGHLPVAQRQAEAGSERLEPAQSSRVMRKGTSRLLDKLFPQYALAFTVFAMVSLLDIRLQELIGYQAIALVSLLAIVVLALFVSRGPILFGTALTALGWNFLSAPPRYSFHISSFYDKMMFATYLVVALTIGQLTTRLRAHREKEVKTKLLAESERLSRTLLNSVSHELRTPLATITSAANELNAHGVLTPMQQELLAEIETAGARLNRVVQGLLNAARIQSGQLRPKLDWCDISELVRSATEEVGGLTADHPLAVNIASGLPLVKMDFVLMQQVLTNVLVNAATHTKPGTPIDVSARVKDGNLYMEVADMGPGLPVDQLERIFDLFHRTPAAKPGGTGLGLSIVKGFVEIQGGSVVANNRAGGGAVFTICMPAGDLPSLPEEPL